MKSKHPMKRKKVIKKADCDHCTTVAHTPKSIWPVLIETGGLFALAIIAYKIFQLFDLTAFAPSTEQTITLPAAFLIGVAASVSSCLALVGGMLLSVSAAWCQAHPKATMWNKFQPLFLFNIGRLIGYFILGGLIAVIGAQIGLTAKGSGVLTVALAIIMLWLGLKILGLLPKKYCSIPLPKALQSRIRALANSRNPMTPMILGSLTFFVPCGFTQSIQIVALASGSFLSGALIMFAFALGTLPSLLGISALSSFVEGKIGKFFFRFSGAVVVLLAVLNINAGLLISGINIAQHLPSFGVEALATNDPNVFIDKNGQQIMTMTAGPQGYNPAHFTIAADKPTWVFVNAPNGVSGCASTLTVPTLGASVQLKKGENWLKLGAPKKNFTMVCSMGMFPVSVDVKQPQT